MKTSSKKTKRHIRALTTRDGHNARANAKGKIRKMIDKVLNYWERFYLFLKRKFGCLGKWTSAAADAVILYFASSQLMKLLPRNLLRWA
jgi:hypothetical protein